MKTDKGITLVALVVTVIVLIILAAVTINLLIGTNGIITRAQQGTQNWQLAEEDEKYTLDSLEAEINDLLQVEETEEQKSFIAKLNITSGDVIQINFDANTEYTIDWGDGTSKEQYTVGGSKIHTYNITNPDIKIEITGTVKELWIPDMIQLTEIVQWGVLGVERININNCNNLEKIASPTKNSFSTIERFDDFIINCPKLEKIPENLFAYCGHIEQFSGTFSNIGIKEIPEKLFWNCKNVKWMVNVFVNCINLETIPARLFEKNNKAVDFTSIFQGCTGIQSIPANLFDNCPEVIRFINAFEGCTSLTGVSPELWLRVIDDPIEYEGYPNGKGCFANCVGLDNYSTIPTYWKTKHEQETGN